MLNIISSQENQIMRGHISPTRWAKIFKSIGHQVEQWELLNTAAKGVTSTTT